MFPFNYQQHFVLSFCLLFSSSIYSGEVVNSKVSHKNNQYEALLEMQIHAPIEKVYALFTDFDDLAQLSKNITDSNIISDDAPDYIVEVESHNCVLFFCKDLKQTQSVLILDDGYISVEDIAGQSDFIYARSVWHIRAYQDGTRVTFRSELKPDFWLPALIGPWLFKKRMIADTQAMIEHLEKLASE